MNLSAAFLSSLSATKIATSPALLAVSGGLDSMVMASLFLEAGLPFAVAHCNFGLRGDASDGDEAMVKAWCEQHNIQVFINRFDTKKESEHRSKGIQETARQFRYEWFEQVRAAHQFASICTAHHADDNAETVLMNLCRSTGIAGLHGIPERNEYLFRPLLFATRKDLETYATAQQISYREDSSNASDDYLRNAVRHHILPAIEQWMPGAAGRILETSNRIREAEEIYTRAIELERKKLLQLRGNDYYVPVKLLRHRTPLATIVYELFRPFGFTAQQVPFTLDLLNAGSGKFIASPTHRLIRNRDFLIITSLKETAADMVLIENFTDTVITADAHFDFSLLRELPETFATDTTTALIDTAKLEQPIILRRWKTGDYFYPLGMGMKKKKLSRFLIDLKIPVHGKEKIWVLESNKRIVWIAGLRLDERFKVKPGTREVLRIKAQEL